MADKSVGELIAAQSVTPTDLFVLEQNGTAKKLTGQILENWLVSFADGHGGIHNIEKVKTSGLVDTYRITLADTTTFDFVVTNGRDVRSIKKTAAEGLVDTYTITYNDNTTNTFTVTNGAKGDTGDNAYIWVKYASQEPTAPSDSFGDLPDDWMGVYFGTDSTAPSDWQQYKWYRIKGEKGDTGDPATVVSNKTDYQVSTSGSIIPSGVWQTNVPVVPQGKYLWTRTVTQFNTGDPVTAYSVARFGIDGAGSVSSVANISPDENGNVPLTASDIDALPATGGDMTGPINMNGQSLSGLNPPTQDTEAATKGYVDTAKNEAVSYTNAQVKKAVHWNLLGNTDWINPVNQRGVTNESIPNRIFIDRWVFDRSKETGAYSLGTDGITFGAGTWLKQFLPYTQSQMDGKTFTVVIWLADGTVWLKSLVFTAQDSYVSAPWNGQGIGTYFNGSYWSVTLANVPDCTIKYVALYEGEYTIDTLPNYQPKGYSAELMECKRYFIAIKEDADGNAPAYSGFCSGTVALITIPTNVNMRGDSRPGITDLDMRGIVCNGNVYGITSYTVVGWQDGYVKISFAGEFPENQPCVAMMILQINNDL